MTIDRSGTRTRLLLHVAPLMVLAIASFSDSQRAVAQAVPTSVCVDKRGCGGEPAPSPSRASSDNSESNAAAAAALAASAKAANDAAEAAAKAAAEHRALVAKRIADKAEAQADFARGIGSVKLKGIAGGAGLKGSAPTTGSALTLKTGAPPEKSPAERQKLAWKQLHCATAIARRALEALQTQDGITDFRTLQTDALRALDGGASAAKIVCDAAPEMPETNSAGGAVDVEAGKIAERTVLERAGEIATVMEAQAIATGSPAVIAQPVGPPARETERDKIRRVQQELNRINSVKTGTTQSAINESESLRLKLGNLVLVNNNLAKGETVDLSVILTDSPAPAPKNQPVPAKPKR